MKIALLGDAHWGARNDNQAFHEHFDKFYRNIFFPYLKEQNITEVIQLGDIFDRRKYINFLTLYKAREYFFDVINENNIKLTVLTGNHDTFFKNSNDVNSPDLLLGEYSTIDVVSSVRDKQFGECKITLLPWICADNYNKSIEHIRSTDAQILMGHLELAGFEMHRGMFNEHGTLDIRELDKFDVVCSGHFHHISSRGNIHYLGTPYEMTWTDFQDPRGFHIFDTNTRELTFIRNPYCMFNKVHYNDSNTSLDELLSQDFSNLENSYVKVIVHNKENPYWFDKFINAIEKAGVLDLQVVDDHLNLNLEDDSDIIDEAEDTLTILRKVVDGIDTRVDKKDVEKMMTNLYNQALQWSTV